MGVILFTPYRGVGTGGPGDVVGPAISTDTAVALFDGVTGKLLKNSVVLIDGAGNMVVPGTVDGRDISADGAKLDTIAAGATNTPLTAAAPADVTKAASAVGISIDAARADHKHDITTASAVELTDSTDAEGAATTLARSDHTHAHGARGGGTLHALAVASGAAGFMSGSDKAKLDALPTGGFGAPLIWGANSIASTTVTRYLYPGFGNATADTNAIQFRVPRAGTFRNMRVYHNIPAGNGNPIVYTLRVNGIPSALSVSMASTASDGSNLVTTVAVVAGALVSLEITKAASIGSSPVDVLASLELA